MIRAAAALLLPLAAAASDPLEGRLAGPAQDCIDISATNGPDIVDAHTILYRRGATIYRAAIEGCTPLRPFSTLIVEIYGNQLCRNDRFRVREANSIIPSAYCRFGRFTPYTRVRARTG